MKLLSFFITSFIYSVFTQDNFDINKDNYDIQSKVTESDGYGFTIEYHGYYKVVTNLMTSRTYCLIGGNATVPEACQSAISFNTPIPYFSVDTGYDAVMPFIELLGIQNLVVKTNTSQVTSPCFKDSIMDTSTISPPMSISSKTNENIYVDFSADQDSLTPLQRAAWIMYLGAFFDLEAISVSIYNELSSNYECHKANIAASSNAVPIAWTSFDASKRLYTVHSEIYYNQLVSDAGGHLVYTNVAQSDLFNMSIALDQQLLAQAISGANYIIDTSDTSIDYTTYINGNPNFFLPNMIRNISAITQNHIYTTNGLVNTNNISDWSQRSLARPDLALLEIIRFLYPNFSTHVNMFPIWLSPFDTVLTQRRLLNEDIYGGCKNMSHVAFEQSECTWGGSTLKVSKKLSQGDKAGISIGSILFVIIAMIAGIWAFRKYQRRKRRHNFYRMNDL